MVRGETQNEINEGLADKHEDGRPKPRGEARSLGKSSFGVSAPALFGPPPSRRLMEVILDVHWAGDGLTRKQVAQ